MSNSIDPAPGMKVVWNTQNLPLRANQFVEKVLIPSHGADEMTILTAEESTVGWLVTIGRNGEPLRQPWTKEEDRSSDSKTGMVQLNWAYFRLVSEQ